MRPDLDNRDWPVPLNRDPRYAGSAALAGLYRVGREGLVEEGYVLAKELGIRGSGRPIPPGECAITSLAAADGWIYGGTSGERAHVFAYCSRPGEEFVLDLLALGGRAAIRDALAWLPEHGLFAGVGGEPGADHHGEVLRIHPPGLVGNIIQEWNPRAADWEALGAPVPGEGIACMTGDAARGRLYGLSDRTGTLFSVDVASGEMATHGEMDELHRFSPHLIVGPDGLVYGCGTAGRIVSLNPDSGAIEEIGLHLPCMAGRRQYARVGAWALDERSGTIYAGDVADGLLSALDVRTGRTRVLGKPTSQPHVRALAVAPDGRLYGIAGRRDTICHLFCYDPAGAELRDLGVMTSGGDVRWYGFEFDSAVAGPDGRIYFGESDRISHLFVYFPPMAAPSKGLPGPMPGEE